MSYRGNRLQDVLCLILGERITLLLPSLGQRGLPLGSRLRLRCFKVRKATAVGQLSRITAETEYSLVLGVTAKEQLPS